MINKSVNIDEIIYIKKEYDSNLYESIIKRGVSIPIRVKAMDKGYECIDGHKRLSVLSDLSKIDVKYNYVIVMIVNDFTKAGSGYWGITRNKH